MVTQSGVSVARPFRTHQCDLLALHPRPHIQGSPTMVTDWLHPAGWNNSPRPSIWVYARFLPYTRPPGRTDRLPLRHDAFQVEPLGRGEEVTAAALDREHAREHGARRRDDALERALAARERQPPEILPVEPEDVERGVVEVPRRARSPRKSCRPTGSSATTSPSRIASFTRSSWRTQSHSSRNCLRTLPRFERKWHPPRSGRGARGTRRTWARTGTPDHRTAGREEPARSVRPAAA